MLCFYTLEEFRDGKKYEIEIKGKRDREVLGNYLESQALISKEIMLVHLAGTILFKYFF